MQRDGADGNGAGNYGVIGYGASNSSNLRYSDQGQSYRTMAGGMSESQSSLSLTGLGPLDISLGSLTSNALFGSLNWEELLNSDHNTGQELARLAEASQRLHPRPPDPAGNPSRSQGPDAGPGGFDGQQQHAGSSMGMDSGSDPVFSEAYSSAPLAAAVRPSGIQRGQSQPNGNALLPGFRGFQGVEQQPARWGPDRRTTNEIWNGLGVEMTSQLQPSASTSMPSARQTQRQQPDAVPSLGTYLPAQPALEERRTQGGTSYHQPLPPLDAHSRKNGSSGVSGGSNGIVSSESAMPSSFNSTGLSPELGHLGIYGNSSTETASAMQGNESFGYPPLQQARGQSSLLGSTQLDYVDSRGRLAPPMPLTLNGPGRIQEQTQLWGTATAASTGRGSFDGTALVRSDPRHAAQRHHLQRLQKQQQQQWGVLPADGRGSARSHSTSFSGPPILSSIREQQDFSPTVHTSATAPTLCRGSATDGSDRISPRSVMSQPALQPVNIASTRPFVISSGGSERRQALPTLRSPVVSTPVYDYSSRETSSSPGLRGEQHSMTPLFIPKIQGGRHQDTHTSCDPGLQQVVMPHNMDSQRIGKKRQMMTEPSPSLMSPPQNSPASAPLHLPTSLQQSTTTLWGGSTRPQGGARMRAFPEIPQPVISPVSLTPAKRGSDGVHSRTHLDHGRMCDKDEREARRKEANRESAARSRDKRLKLISDLEVQVQVLKRQHADFKTKVIESTVPRPIALQSFRGGPLNGKPLRRVQTDPADCEARIRSALLAEKLDMGAVMSSIGQELLPESSQPTPDDVD